MKPEVEAGIERRALDALPSSIVTVDAEGVVRYVNAPAREMIPTIVPGTELREELENLTHVEMVDRMLLRRELTSFAVVPGGPVLNWMVWDTGNAFDELVLTVWEVDWSEAMNERRADFMMAASHELRGPLTTLRGFAEILNMDTANMTPEQAEAAAIVERTAVHLAVLVEDVFDLSRNSFGELRLNLGPTCLGEIVRSVVSVAGPRIAEREQTLDAEIEAGLPIIDADPARSTQMISNLVNNASIHNPEGVHITVSARLEGERIAVSVKDDGQGLPFDDPDDAFHSFRRGDDATVGDRTGSGIGLSITKRLVQLHRGKISVESSRGEGTCFTLWFPVDRSTALEVEEPGPV